jgi:hypothetical protein
MANLLNLDAETGSNAIYDDTSAGLTLENSSTGAALALDKLQVDSDILAANATVGVGVSIRGSSVASGAVLAFTSSALVSCTTIKCDTGGVAGTKAIRVVVEDGTFAWIPVYPDGAITAAAV